MFTSQCSCKHEPLIKSGISCWESWEHLTTGNRLVTCASSFSEKTKHGKIVKINWGWLSQAQVKLKVIAEVVVKLGVEVEAEVGGAF